MLSSQVTGYLCCLVAVLGFGSNYIPTKKIDVRDGMFFSLCLTVGILFVGIVQWMLTGFYKFEPFAMLGGTVWATANMFVPFIIQNLGLGIGQLVWSATNMLTGWATGTFGLFGKIKDPVAHQVLNYVGVVLSLFALSLFKLMKNADDKPAADSESGGNLPVESLNPEQARNVPSGGRGSRRFAIGFVVALLAGVLMGSAFDAATYLQQQGQADKDAGLDPSQWRHSPDAMDYVLSHFVGIFFTTALYFLIYCMVSKNRHVAKEIVVPGFLAGVLWGIAQACWFNANGVLSYVLAFPIIVGVPGVIAALWGCILFGENRGNRNRAVLASVIMVQLVGVTLIAVSRGS
mmetsp:Transcript_137706/g.294284  ORF Transcript_137706/g.294284 Transcript_137706/m.294284 type:complete len:347 (-) Transcript_137706:78-1118(-)